MLALALLALALQQPAPEPPAAPPPPAVETSPALPAVEASPAPPAAPRPATPPRVPAPPRAPRAAAGADEQGEEPVLQGFERKSGKRFTADLDEAEVGDAIRQIAEAADWSVVLPSGEHGAISARFKDAPVEDALKAVLAQAGLVAVREGAVVTVRPASGLPALRGLSRDVRRATEQAQRLAERELRRAEREMRRALKDGGAKDGGTKDGGTKDKVVQGDVVVRASQPARDVVALRGSIKVEPGGEVRDAVAVLGSVILEPGAHAREAVAIGGDVRLGPGAEVEKDVVSVGGSVVRDPGAEIGGEEVSIGIPALSGLAGLAGSRMLFDRHESPAFVAAQVLAKFLVFFALGLLVLALFPRRLDAVSSSFTAHPWKSVLTGLLGIVVAPLVVILLVATIIGIPLVAVAALMALAAGVLGFTALSLHIGRALPIERQRWTHVLQLAVGTAIVVLVTAIPVIGCMAWVAAALLTFGAVLRSRFGSQLAVLPTTIPPASPPPAPAA